MHNLRRYLGLCICVLAFQGCTSSPPIDYYRLQPLELAASEDGPGAAVVGLGPLRFPEYLRQPQLVQRGPGARMQLNELNRWVEPLDEAAPRVLAANVDVLLDGVVVVPFPTVAAPEVEYRITGNVIRFEPDETGQVELVVQWRITQPGEGTVMAPRTSRYTAEASNREPQAVAEAMSDALAKFSRDLVAALERVLEAAPG